MDQVSGMGELDWLIISAQSGDLDAFGTIVRRFQDMAVGYAYSILGDFHLAQDAAQEAFIEAHRDLAKVYGAVAFPAWFRRIVFKQCDRFTRRLHRQTVQLEHAVSIPSAGKSPLEVAEDEEIRQIVLSAVRSLPEEERSVTTLFYIDGYSYKEIAAFLEMPVTTVDNRLRSSRKRLKRRMVGMVEERLRIEQPSRDDSFTSRVRLFNAMEVRDMDRVKELLNTDAAHAALYDFLKIRAEEQGMTIEELVVWLIQQYKERIEAREARVSVFKEKVESQEKQEALHEIETFYNEARFHQGAIADMAHLVAGAEHNISVITHCAYLASKFGYHTVPLIDVAKLVASCDHECGELRELAELVVLRLWGTTPIVQLAESAVKAQSEEEKEKIKQEIEKIKATANFGSLEEALEDQQQRQRR